MIAQEDANTMLEGNKRVLLSDHLKWHIRFMMEWLNFTGVITMIQQLVYSTLTGKLCNMPLQLCVFNYTGILSIIANQVSTSPVIAN